MHSVQIEKWGDGAIKNAHNARSLGTRNGVNISSRVIPNEINYSRMAVSDTLPEGKGRKITGVSSSGILTYKMVVSK